jgi:exonuclease SbcC
MLFQRVHVRAFGPFRDRSIELAPGLTIIFGPNEAGKSTWHAAVYAALCGMRRSRGTPSKEDQDFAALHRPWSGEGWQASTVVEMADGRRIEIRQDLERGVECSAIDLDLGDELSAAIVREGTPDGSVWLGLDRRTFLATACVRQADVLDGLRSAEGLQDHLQRATATGGADETAARALDLLAEFEREHVGRDQTNATKPLRRARERVERAQVNRILAAAEHERYLEGAERLDRLEVEVTCRERDRAAFEAAVWWRKAAGVRRALDRATDLQGRLPDQDQPSLPDEDELSGQVAAVLAGYETMPPSIAPEGPGSDQVKDELEGLPVAPEGDVEPHQSVTAALGGWRASEQALAVHDRGRPADPEVGTSLPSSTVRGLAADLESALAQATVSSARETHLWPWLVAGGGAAALGAGFTVGGYWLPGLALLLLGAAAVARGALHSASRSRQAELDELRAAEVPPRRSEVEARARQLGLPADPTRLRQEADRVEAARLQRRQVESWWVARRDHEQMCMRSATALREALAARRAEPQGDLAEACRAYEAACGERATQARRAARRSDLEIQLRQCERLAERASQVERQRQEVVAALKAAAYRCGVSTSHDDALAQGLRSWQARRSEELQRRQLEQEDRNQLRSLLGEGTLQDLEARAAREECRAADLAADFEPQELDAVPLDGDPEGRLAELAREVGLAREATAAARSELATLGRELPTVAAAEEELAGAKAELDRVQRLAGTVQTVRESLKSAEERVHRDIAPRLKAKLEAWLPRITGGRYQEATVNPETLGVRVRAAEGEWRDATRLSLGTREQIYLLLRVALVEHLGNPSESCPLLLDEVTAQSDASRTGALLELLHEISLERQVVLFTQEEDVLRWGRRCLVDPRDRLLVLDAAVVPA